MNPEIAVIEEKALSVPDQATAIAIQDDGSYTKAGELLLTIKDLRKEISTTFGPIITKAHEAHKEAIAQRNKVDEPLVKAEYIIKPKMATYIREQERKVEEERIRREAEARSVEQEQKLAEAVAAEEGGDTQEAEAILNDPTPAPAFVDPTPAVPKVSGISSKKDYDFSIKNPGQIRRNYMMPNEKAIRAMVKQFGKRAELMIGGISVYEKISLAAGGRR